MISQQFAKNFMKLLELEGCILQNEYQLRSASPTSHRSSSLSNGGLEQEELLLYGRPGD
jgi:hypothetical protein